MWHVCAPWSVFFSRGKHVVCCELWLRLGWNAGVVWYPSGVFCVFGVWFGSSNANKYFFHVDAFSPPTTPSSNGKVSTGTPTNAKWNTSPCTHLCKPPPSPAITPLATSPKPPPSAGSSNQTPEKYKPKSATQPAPSAPAPQKHAPSAPAPQKPAHEPPHPPCSKGAPAPRSPTRQRRPRHLG